MASISPPTTRGPQNPGKYPRTGPTYAYYGEQPGFVYNPWTDRYVVDPNAQREYEEQQGIREKEPKPPSAVGTLATTIGGLAAGTAAVGLTKAGIESALAESGTAATTATGATTATAAGGATVGGANALSGGALAGNGLYTPVATNMTAGSPAVTSAPVASSGLLGTAIPVAGAALGTYLAGKSALNTLKGKEDKSVGGLIGRGQLAITTGGLSEIARPFFMKPSTRDIAKKHTKELLSVAPEDQNYQNYVMGMREQFNAGPPDPSKPFAGKYASFEEYKKAGLQAPDLTGVYGNIKTYGPKWAGLTQDQRVAVTQLNINDNLYNPRKGEVEITDEEKAKANLETVLKTLPATGGGLIGVNKGPLPANQNAAVAAASGGLLPQRTGTSPGFDKNGRRINYGKS